MRTGKRVDGSSDEQLMLRCAAGSSEAFGEIVERYHDKVLGLIVMMTGRRERARELAQDCFLKLLESAGRYTVKARFSTYLFTIARRLVFDDARRKKGECANLSWKLKRLPTLWFDEVAKRNINPRARSRNEQCPTIG